MGGLRSGEEVGGSGEQWGLVRSGGDRLGWWGGQECRDCGSRWGGIVGSGREGGEGSRWRGMVGLLPGFCPPRGLLAVRKFRGRQADSHAYCCIKRYTLGSRLCETWKGSPVHL